MKHKILFIDHEDSFSWNLVAELNSRNLKCHVKTLPANTLGGYWVPTQTSANDFFAPYSGIVLSPGPGHPREYPITQQLVTLIPPQMPLLGVCLGWQIVAEMHGLKVEERHHSCFDKQPQSQLMHGRRETLATPLWARQKQPTKSFCATFFNSLAVKAPKESHHFPFEFLHDSHGMVALAKHSSLPWLLTQFHPESYASTSCEFVFEFFFEAVEKYSSFAALGLFKTDTIAEKGS